MNLRKLKCKKAVLAFTYQSDGLFVTEDTCGNIFAMDRSGDGEIRYACMYGGYLLNFYEKEIVIIEYIINKWAKLIYDSETITDKYIRNRKSNEQINKSYNRDKIIAKEPIDNCMLYASLWQKKFYYYIEQGDRRIGGRLGEWRHTISDWKDLAESFEEWERSM